MSSENKKRKISKRNHPGRGKYFLKSVKPLKGIAFFNSNLRRILKYNEYEDDDQSQEVFHTVKTIGFAVLLVLIVTILKAILM